MSSKKKTKLKSTCCDAPVKIGGVGDFNDKDKVCTLYSVCTKCGNPCDIKSTVRKTWEINPKTRIAPNKKQKNLDKLSKEEIERYRKSEDF
jgi:hypothetical protein